MFFFCLLVSALQIRTTSPQQLRAHMDQPSNISSLAGKLQFSEAQAPPHILVRKIDTETCPKTCASFVFVGLVLRTRTNHTLFFSSVRVVRAFCSSCVQSNVPCVRLAV